MNTRMKALSTCALATMLAITAASPAEAHGHGLHGGPLVGVLALAGLVTVAAVSIVTAPVRMLAEPQPAYYPPQPAYYPPPQAAYAPQPAYYQPYPPQAYYPPAPYYPAYPAYR